MSTIDLAADALISLRQAANHPALVARTGRAANPETLRRWCIRGLRGIKLANIRAGGVRVTTLRSLEEFFQRLTEQDAEQAADAELVGAGEWMHGTRT